MPAFCSRSTAGSRPLRGLRCAGSAGSRRPCALLWPFPTPALPCPQPSPLRPRHLVRPLPAPPAASVGSGRVHRPHEVQIVSVVQRSVLPVRFRPYRLPVHGFPSVPSPRSVPCALCWPALALCCVPAPSVASCLTLFRLDGAMRFRPPDALGFPAAHRLPARRAARSCRCCPCPSACSVRTPALHHLVPPTPMASGRRCARRRGFRADTVPGCTVDGPSVQARLGMKARRVAAGEVVS